MESHFEEFLSNPDYKLASIWKRIVSFILDFIVYITIGYIIAIYAGTIKEDGAGYHLSGLPALIQILIGFALWPVSESLTGQTIGKRIMNIKVVSDSLGKITFGQAFKRYILGIADYAMLSGLVVSKFNKRNKRIGDIVGKTIVIQNDQS